MFYNLYNLISIKYVPFRFIVVAISKMKEAHRQFLQLTNGDFALELEKYGMLASIGRLFAHSFDEELAYPLMNIFF